jgi:hypothetical protein
VVLLGALVVGVEVGLDVCGVRPVELDQAVAEQMHGAHEARHLPAQEVDEAVDRTLVQALRELHPGVGVEGAADQAHVDPVEPTAVAQQGVLDLRPGGQLFELHQLVPSLGRSGRTGSCT